jgi:hypothetical protein
MIAALASAVAVAFSPLPELQAAPFGGAGPQLGSSGVVHLAQAEKKAPKKASKKKGKKKAKGKKAKGKKAKGKKAKGKKAGKGTKTASCGTYMYRKGGKCVDARNKK